MGHHPRLYLVLLLFAAGCAAQPEWKKRARLLSSDFPRAPKKGARCLSDEVLGKGLLAAVRSVKLDQVFDYGPLFGEGCPSEKTPACLGMIGSVGRAHHPQVDLSTVVFNPPGCKLAVAKATVVFDRSHPDGFVGQHDPKSLQLTNIRFRKWDEARWNGGQFSWSAKSASTESDTPPSPVLLPGSELLWESPFPNDSLLNPSVERAAGSGIDFMSPWPASSFKLMVATRLAALLDAGKAADGSAVRLDTLVEVPTAAQNGNCPKEARQLSLQQLMETMLQWSGNCATAALVRFLHDHQEVVQSDKLDARGFPIAPPLRSSVNSMLAGLGLTTLQMNRTMAKSGRWGTPDNNYARQHASVAHNHMTSWDAARLMWLLDELPAAQKPRWEVAPGQTVAEDFLSPQTKALLRGVLRDSYSGSGLSNNRTCEIPSKGELPEVGSLGFGNRPVPGIPALLSLKWVRLGMLQSAYQDYPYASVLDDVGPSTKDPSGGRDLSGCQSRAEVTFLNKPGLTNVAASSVGIVRGLGLPGEPPPQAHGCFSRHYIVSFFSTLGTRYVDEARLRNAGLTRSAEAVTRIDTTQSIPLLGARLDAWLASWLEADSPSCAGR